MRIYEPQPPVGVAESKKEITGSCTHHTKKVNLLWGHKGRRYRHRKILSRRFIGFEFYTNHYVRRCDACITIRQEDHTGDNKGNSSKNQREGTSYERGWDKSSTHDHNVSEQESQRRPESFWEECVAFFFLCIFFSSLINILVFTRNTTHTEKCIKCTHVNWHIIKQTLM